MDRWPDDPPAPDSARGESIACPSASAPRGSEGASPVNSEKRRRTSDGKKGGSVSTFNRRIGELVERGYIEKRTVDGSHRYFFVHIPKFTDAEKREAKDLLSSTRIH